MEGWILWVAIAVAALLFELMTQMVVALCVAIGCLVAMVVALCAGTPIWQVIGLAIGALASFALLVPLLRRRLERRASLRHARTGMDALLGRRAVVTHEIEPGKLGRARIDGDNWQVRSSCSETIGRGATVIVTSFDSIILDVEPENL